MTRNFASIRFLIVWRPMTKCPVTHDFVQKWVKPRKSKVSGFPCANYMALFIGLGVGLSHGEIGKSALYLGLAAGVANPIILLVRLCHERRSGADAVAHPYLVGVELEDSFI